MPRMIELVSLWLGKSVMMMALLRLSLLLPLAASGSSDSRQNCSFIAGRDYSDPAGPVLNATSASHCCKLCLDDLHGCAVAVFAPPASTAGVGVGKCYTKTSAKSPIDKGHASNIVGCVTSRSEVTDKFYDCRFRKLALEFVRTKVVGGWASAAMTAEAIAAVANGLRIDQCVGSDGGEGSTTEAEAEPAPLPRSAPQRPAVEVFISPDGDDAAAGTVAAPLRSIGGAQAHIRKAYPTVSSRPAILVTLREGDYYTPARSGPPGALNSPRAATFAVEDSGSSAEHPIVYAAELDPATSQPVAATLHGGIQLDLTWGPAAGARGAMRATLPAGVEIDSQDQLFRAGQPLVRARIPNGRPWLPLDGFNLTAGNASAAMAGATLPNIAPVVASCGPAAQPSKPTPNPHPQPSTPEPALGECGAMIGNITLLSGSSLGPPDFLVVGLTDNATACQKICAQQECCSGFTWHDRSMGQWAHKCYLVTNPLDVWTRAGRQVGHVSGLCNHGPVLKPCTGKAVSNDADCKVAKVVCAGTGDAMVQGPVAATGGLDQSGVVKVTDCYEHLPDAGNSWPVWKSQGYGLADQNKSLVNAMTFDQNFPLWFGPWASGITVEGSQDAGSKPLKSLAWSDAAQGQIVVHAMADGEWGGVQFKVSNATKLPNGDATLAFSEGGWQQARGANLHASAGRVGNRFYVEGSMDFLDEAGEWHFDPVSRDLYVIPPPGVQAMGPLVLTQTDSLLRFEGKGGGTGGHVQHIQIANLTLEHTSAQFFLPHEETSGGDYAITRSAAIFAENASALVITGNTLKHIGGNGIFLSNSVSNVTIVANRFSFLGTSGVLIVGRTGRAMMDGRDGEAMVAAGGEDNGVRLPKHNVVEKNVFSDYGVWDKQSAAFHKAVAPGNTFAYNVVFNCSRHGVNFQDSMGGEGLVHHNVFFNLNRETTDTAALNSWGRRVYVFSESDADPSTPRLVPTPGRFNRWRNNLVLNRNYWGVRDGNGNCLRCDDGASWFNMSENVCYAASSAMEFNGGSQVYTHGNLFVQGGWTLCAAPPGAGGGSHDTYIDSPFMWSSICGANKCLPLWESNNATHVTSAGMCKNRPGMGMPWGDGPHTCKPTILRSDFNTLVVNSTGSATVLPDYTDGFCSLSLSEWRAKTHGDEHTRVLQGPTPEFSPDAVLAKARELIFGGGDRGGL